MENKNFYNGHTNAESNRNQGIYKALYLNEIMCEDNELNTDGYIELYNDSNKRINLKGYYLSNSTYDLEKWQLPDVRIGPYELLTVWTSGKKHDEPEKTYANFKISSGNCPVILTAPDGVTTIDIIDLKAMNGKKSFGRYPDGSSDLQYLRKPTPDSSNNNINLTNAPGKPGIALTWDDDNIDEWHGLLEFEWFNNTRNTFSLTQPFRLNEEKWKKLQDLKNHGHEIASHGYNHVNALDYIKSYGMNPFIENEVMSSINLMNKNGFFPTSFAYPYGVNSKIIDTVLLQHFSVLRTTSYSPGGNPFKWGSTKVLPANGMDHNYPYTLEDFFKWLETAKSNNQVVILYGHMPTPELSGNYRTSHKRLEAIIEKARELGLVFYTLSDLGTDIGNLTVNFPPNITPGSEWSLDRKEWLPGGATITLPVGNYTVMFRNMDDVTPMAVEIKKEAAAAIIKAE